MSQFIVVSKSDIKRIETMLGDMKRKTPNVLANASNRAATTVNASIKREVRKKYIVKAGDIQQTITKKRASKSNPYTEVVSKGNLLGLDKFKVLPRKPNPRRKAPIKVSVKKGEGAKKILQAFVADINGSKVMRRQGKSRLPIQRLFGPSVPQMIDNEKVRNQIQNDGFDTFTKRLDHEITRLVGGK
jgi:hypothetical protein